MCRNSLLRAYSVSIPGPVLEHRTDIAPALACRYVSTGCLHPVGLMLLKGLAPAKHNC